MPLYIIILHCNSILPFYTVILHCHSTLPLISFLRGLHDNLAVTFCRTDCCPGLGPAALRSGRAAGVSCIFTESLNCAENIFSGCPQNGRSASCLNWPIVTRAHAPRQVMQLHRHSTLPLTVIVSHCTVILLSLLSGDAAAPRGGGAAPPRGGRA